VDKRKTDRQRQWTSQRAHHETMAQEDIDEGVNRMVDEGGGVVDQDEPNTPVLRNSLVDVGEPEI
jgi:hypothetical protein